MATLTNGQLAALRKTARDGYDWGVIDFDKPDANAAFQAIEDWYQAHKVDAATRINTATEPGYTFTNQEKQVIAAAYFRLRFDLDGGGQ